MEISEKMEALFGELEENDELWMIILPNGYLIL